MPVHEALKLAVEHLESVGPALEGDFRLTASRVDDRWVFWFQLLPETPGRDVTVFVSDTGAIETLAGM